ncbi:zinc knuckle CX2CX4HX4C containing protein [Tanacetum coccineum]
MLDDGDSTIKVKELVEVGTKLEKVDAMDVIDAKEKVPEKIKHEVFVFTKAPLQEHCEPFMRFSTPFGVKQNGAWDAELNLAYYDNYMSEDMLNTLGFVRLDYGRKMVKEVRVEIHGYDFHADFVVVDYVNEGEPSIEDKDVDTLLANLVEDMVEVENMSDDLVKMDMATSDSVATNLIDKIKNNDSKMVKDGKLRQAMRGVALNKSGMSEQEAENPNNADHSMSDIDGKMLGNGWEDPKIQAMKASEQVVNTTSIQQPKSFVNVLSAGKTKPKINFRSLFNEERVDNADFVLPIENVEIAHSRFANSLVGFFVGKRVAFPLVQNYVNNTWSKFGFQKVIKDDDDVYYFKLTSLTSLEQVLEKGPWIIRNQPMILTKWAPNVSISKGTVTKPIMLDAFTSAMCSEPWGRIGFARALIKVSAEKDLKKEVTMVVPVVEGEGHTLEKMVVEYEWTPPQLKSKDVQADGFTTVKNRKNKGKKTQPRNIEGTKLSKPKVNFVWEKKQPNKDIATTSSSENATDTKATSVTPKAPDVALKNSFASLPDEDASIWGDEQTWMNAKQAWKLLMKVTLMMVMSLLWKIRMVNAWWIKKRGQSLPFMRFTMIKVASWNIRGLNFSPKQSEVRHVISENNLSVCAILESPWCILGDFNAALFLDDKAAGMSSVDISMREFKECVEDIEVMDVQSLGLHFTWSQKPKGKDVVLKKIDRIMANLGFNDMFVGAHAIFRPFCVYDHAPSILCIPTVTKPKPRPFKFFNILTCNDRFKDVVAEAWSMQVSGFSMFKVVKKQKHLKKPFRKLLLGFEI